MTPDEDSLGCFLSTRLPEKMAYFTRICTLAELSEGGLREDCDYL